MKPQSIKVYFVRTSLCLAIFSSATVIFFHFVGIKERIRKTEFALKQQTDGRRVAETQLAKANAALAEITINLNSSRQETVRAVADSVAQKNRAEKLARALSVSDKEKNGAKAELARYQAAEMLPEQIVQAAAEIKNLRLAFAASEKEKALFKRQMAQRDQVDAGDDVLLPAGLKTKVLRYDPKWRFVVLDRGSLEGMVKNAELLVSRDGKLAGKIKISRVEQNQSVGNLVSGWQLSDILEGDFAIPAHPGS